MSSDTLKWISLFVIPLQRQQTAQAQYDPPEWESHGPG